jgi:hypothetical protein
MGDFERKSNNDDSLSKAQEPYIKAAKEFKEGFTSRMMADRLNIKINTLA